MPYGEEITSTITPQRTATLRYVEDGIRRKFTSYERDNESSLDFAQNRYYSSRLGRFYSVDPENYGADENDPQSWNGYNYSRNNPVLFVDPDGLEYLICSNDGKECYRHTDDEIKRGKEVGGFIWQGSRDQKTGLEFGVIYDSDGNQIAIYRQISHDDPVMAMIWGAVPTLRVWQPIIENVGTVAIGSFALPPGSGSVVNYLAGTAIKGGTTQAPKILPNLARKLDFLFGKSGGENAQRSLQMPRELEKIGITDSPASRRYVAEVLERASTQPGITQPNGRVLRESILIGPSGKAVKLQSVWEGDKLITVIVKASKVM